MNEGSRGVLNFYILQGFVIHTWSQDQWILLFCFPMDILQTKYKKSLRFLWKNNRLKNFELEAVCSWLWPGFQFIILGLQVTSVESVRRAYHALSVSATCHLDEGYYKSWQGMFCFYLPLFTHLKLCLPFLPPPLINNYMHLVVNEQNVFINF